MLHVTCGISMCMLHVVLARALAHTCTHTHTHTHTHTLHVLHSLRVRLSVCERDRLTEAGIDRHTMREGHTFVPG